MAVHLVSVQYITRLELLHGLRIEFEILSFSMLLLTFRLNHLVGAEEDLVQHVEVLCINRILLVSMANFAEVGLHPEVLTDVARRLLVWDTRSAFYRRHWNVRHKLAAQGGLGSFSLPIVNSLAYPKLVREFSGQNRVSRLDAGLISIRTIHLVFSCNLELFRTTIQLRFDNHHTRSLWCSAIIGRRRFKLIFDQITGALHG